MMDGRDKPVCFFPNIKKNNQPENVFVQIDCSIIIVDLKILKG